MQHQFGIVFKVRIVGTMYLLEDTFDVLHMWNMCRWVTMMALLRVNEVTLVFLVRVIMVTKVLMNHLVSMAYFHNPSTPNNCDQGRSLATLENQENVKLNKKSV